mmetsp:Transcript_46061/g.115973  ORF Transcript_46061/g.115973 Transcript_46061/m.115973 type:complete len:355 (+) Transcript_46061:28-1092(+)
MRYRGALHAPTYNTGQTLHSQHGVQPRSRACGKKKKKSRGLKGAPCARSARQVHRLHGVVRGYAGEGRRLVSNNDCVWLGGGTGERDAAQLQLLADVGLDDVDAQLAARQLGDPRGGRDVIPLVRHKRRSHHDGQIARVHLVHRLQRRGLHHKVQQPQVQRLLGLVEVTFHVVPLLLVVCHLLGQLRKQTVGQLFIPALDQRGQVVGVHEVERLAERQVGLHLLHLVVVACKAEDALLLQPTPRLQLASQQDEDLRHSVPSTVLIDCHRQAVGVHAEDSLVWRHGHGFHANVCAPHVLSFLRRCLRRCLGALVLAGRARLGWLGCLGRLGCLLLFAFTGSVCLGIQVFRQLLFF